MVVPAVTFAEQPRTVMQRATRLALPCLNDLDLDNSVPFIECGDDDTSIVEAVSVAERSILLLETAALTESLLAGLEMLEHSPRIVVRSDKLTRLAIEELVGRGCCGIITSVITVPEIHRMLAAVSAGEMWLERKWSSHIIRQLLARRKDPLLSNRESDILNLLQRNLKNREIAGALAISEETLRWHLRHLYAKTKRQSREELIRYAQMRNFDEQEDKSLHAHAN